MIIDLLLIVMVAGPLIFAVAAVLVERWGGHAGIAAVAINTAAATGMAWTVFHDGPVVHSVGAWGAPLGIDMYVDGLAATMLVLAGVVTAFISLYAPAYFSASHGTAPRYFWPLFLLTLAALNALFISGDLFNLYVTLELLTLAAVALVGLAGSAASLVAALRYLLAALGGSLFYLLGVALLYASAGTVDWRLLEENLSPGLTTYTAITLMTIALMLKAALFPLHFWLPAAHSIAPAPVSALLSAVVLKGSFYIGLRLWSVVVPALEPGAPVYLLLAGLGSCAVLWGSVQALRQDRAKLMLAYSSVAQLGYLFVAFAMLLGESGPLAVRGAAYMALAHAFAKASAFLAVGTIALSFGTDEISRWRGAAVREPIAVFALALAAVSLTGLPPSGGFIGKWLLLTAAMDQGLYVFMAVLVGGGLIAAMYFFRVLGTAMRTRRDPVAESLSLAPSLRWAPLMLGILAIGLGLVSFTVTGLLDVGMPNHM